MREEYDDGYDCAASFEAAGADRPEDMEPDEDEESMNYSHDDILKIARNMENYGGHFASALGTALIHADMGNRDRLAQAFPELFEKYLKFNADLPPQRA